MAFNCAHATLRKRLAQRNTRARRRTVETVGIADAANGDARIPLEGDGPAIADRLACLCNAVGQYARLGFGDSAHRVLYVVDTFAAIQRDTGAGNIEMGVFAHVDAG